MCVGDSDDIFDDCEWLDSDETTCFLKVKYVLSWNSAGFECQRLGGYLASDPDNAALGDLLEGDSDVYWFGLRRHVDMTWSWSDGHMVQMTGTK